MSTSLLYHGFGIRGYRHVSTAFEGGKVIFTVRQDRGALRCAACGSWRVIRRGSCRRQFRSLPIGSRPVQTVLEVARVGCRDCGVVRQVPVGFADERRSYTKAFERYVLELSKRMSIRDVARHLQVRWDVVKDIQKRSLSQRFKAIPLKHLRQVAIDEISIGRGHRYLTVVLDLVSGAVVFVGDGKGAEALEPFWKQLKRAQATIEAVAMDMSPAYISAVLTHLPAAVLVFDHFHIIKLFNEKLSDLRRDLYREATEQLHKDVLKGTRWLLLKNPENLDPARQESRRLQEALMLNQPLATAYYMKEDLRPGMGTSGQTGRPTFPRLLDIPRPKLRHSNAQEVREYLGHPPQPDPELLRLSNLYRAARRNQHPNPSLAAPSLWLPRRGVLKTQNLCPT